MLANRRNALVLGLCLGFAAAACTFDIDVGPTGTDGDGGSGGTLGGSGGSEGGSGGSTGGSGGSDGGSGGSTGGSGGSDGGSGGSEGGSGGSTGGSGGSTGGSGGSTGGSGGSTGGSGGSEGGSGGSEGGSGGSEGGSGGTSGGSTGGSGGSTGGSGGSTGGSGGVGGGTGGEGCLPPMHAVCDTVTQCGCDSGENCHFQWDDGDAVRVCLPVGSASPYSACNEHVDCPRGHGCVDGVCKQYCYTADDCGWEDARCEPVEVQDEAADPEWNVCVRHCDVVSPGDPAPGLQACGSGTTCVPLFETAGSASTAECAPAGDGAAHQPCSDDSDPNNPPCGAGLTCEFGRCLPWCDLAAPECPDDQPCVAHPFPTGLTLADRNLGVCPDDVLYQDDFTDYSLWPWISSPRPLVEVFYGYQTYIIWLFWEGYTFTSSPYRGVYGEDVVVEVDARSDWPFDLAEQALGVYCRGTYLFQVRLNGSVRILAYDHEYEYEYEYCDCDYDDYDCYYECQYGYDFDPWVSLTGWVSSDAIRPTEVNHITASCIGTSPIRLTLHVNGQYVLQLEDSVYAASYQSMGLAVSTFGGAARGEFDNFFAWEP